MKDGEDGGAEDERGARLVALFACRRKLTADEVVLLRAVFGDIYRTHHPEVWEQVRKRRDLSEAEAVEIVQSTFMTLFHEMCEVGFPDRIGAMLNRIAQGKLANHTRGKRRSPMSIGLPSSGSEPVRTPPDVDRALDRETLLARVGSALTDDQRAVFELVVLGGLVEEEAAALLEIPLGTLKSRLLAARKRIDALAAELFPTSKGARSEGGP